MSEHARRITRRNALRIGLGLVAGGILAAAGCQQTPAPAATPAAGAAGGATPAAAKAAAGAKVTLQWWSHTHKPWNDELTRQMKVYVGQSSTVDINYTIYPGGELVTKYTTAMQAGTGPDIIGAHSSMTPNFIGGGWIAELPKEFIDDIKARFYQVCLDGATYQGKVYGYNQHIGGYTPIANVQVFEDNKADYPTTWDDWNNLIAKIDKKGSDGKLTSAVANLAPAGEGFFNSWGSMLKSYGGQFLSDDLKSTAFNTDLGKTVTKQWMQFVHPEMGAAGDIFGQNKNAILYSGPWNRPTFDTNYPNLKYKCLTVMKGPKGQIGNDYIWNWLVSAKVDDTHKAESVKFTQWLNSTENQVSMVKASALIPTTKAALDNPDVQKDEWVKSFISQLEFKQVYVSKISNWAEVEKAIGDEFSLLATGSQSLEDTLKKADTNISALLKESQIYS